MNKNHYNPNSVRAREARLGQVFNHWFMRALIVIFGFAGLSLGVWLIITGESVGWLLIGLADIMMILMVWVKMLLAKVPRGKTDDINDILSSRALVALGKNPTIDSLTHNLIYTRSGRFLAARFGITPSFFEVITQLLPKDQASTERFLEEVFEDARMVADQTETDVVSGGALTIALVENCPGYDVALRQMKLEISDLYEGLIWYNYLYGLTKNAKKKRHDGGIARDFSFGYIPLLSKFGINISAQKSATSKTSINRASHREAIDKMIETFSLGGRQNIALVGPDGCGRSTIVNAFAEEILDADNKKVPSNLKFRQVFKLDAAALVSGAQGDVETLLNRILNEAYAAKNIIIYLDNAHLFFEDGVGAVDISNLLVPILEAGALRIILTMDDQKFLEIAARNPALTNSLNKIVVTPANEDETMRVMEDQVPFIEYQNKVIFTYLALREAYRLSLRYIHDLEMPGKAIRLLEISARYAEHGFVTIESVQQAVEKTQGVKLQANQTQESKSQLLNMEDLIHQRMIDQAEAVKTVSDALRRAAAGVRNENRPIGTFLFLGPTGVGKTELAKSLSAVYFGGESEIVRIDLNEYVTANDVSRLIAEASEDAMSLTAQVLKNPFSVVLLDEIEKAHPQVLTTLLQMLDEGILRDTKNHEVSFRDAIVIATSNAGADKIREYVAAGKDLTSLKDELTNELIASGAFKPEFLNRFDEICVFKPLSKTDLAKVVDIIIAGVNKTLAAQKISVVLDEKAKMLLVERGYDPQLGARPMRRIVQKTVENVVAKMVLAGTAAPGTTIQLNVAMIEEQLQ